MSNTQKKNGAIIAIITMMFLYAMISFVTNLAAPVGTIWKETFADSANANTLGMLGNMMNFAAYLIMGIPAGLLLSKIGYKRSALLGIVLGLVGVFVQFLSGKIGATTGFVVYLTGAFIAGFCVCILNTVVNPMMNLLGGGGNRGNQLNLIGGTLNSLAGTCTPLLVGALIGEVTKDTQMADVNLVLYIAMGVFVLAFAILCFIPITDPIQVNKNVVYERSPWAFRHFVLGAVAIFVYVGVEVGLPGTMLYYLTDENVAGLSMAVAGSVAATYWLLMLVGRFLGSLIANKVSSKALMIATTSIAFILIACAIVLGDSSHIAIPAFTGKSFDMVNVPIAVLFIVLCGLCTSVMWSSIFNLATEGLGKYTSKASGIFMMMVVGGGVLPLLQNFVADHASYMISYIIPLVGVAYMLLYALIGSKNVNKDIITD